MFLYKSAVTKHGSHNQQSHAGSRGKGGAGGGTPKAPSVGRDNVGSGIQDVKDLTDAKMGKLIDQEATNTKYALTQLSEDLQSYAEEAESVAELKEISQTVTYLSQASQLAGKISSIKGSKGKLAQLDKINGKLERAYEKIPSGREMKVLEEYLADGLDFVDNYREALPNLAVTKHGSHNQKTHAGSRGGGAGGGTSSGESKPASSNAKAQAKSQMNERLSRALKLGSNSTDVKNDAKALSNAFRQKDKTLLRRIRTDMKEMHYGMQGAGVPADMKDIANAYGYLWQAASSAINAIED